MAKYSSSPFLKKESYRPATQGFEGEAAGGCGSMGLFNDGASHRQPPDLSGAFGPAVESGQPSGVARALIAKSTGVMVNDGVNPSPDLGKAGNKY